MYISLALIIVLLLILSILFLLHCTLIMWEKIIESAVEILLCRKFVHAWFPHPWDNFGIFQGVLEVMSILMCLQSNSVAVYIKKFVVYA